MRHFGGHGHVGGRTTPSRSETPRGSWLAIHYVVLVGALFSTIAALNVLDLWTSSVALSRGMLEGNGLVLALAGQLGVKTIEGLLVTKAVGILGGLTAALIGIRMHNLQIRREVVLVMAFLAAILFAVSLNNLYLILF